MTVFVEAEHLAIIRPILLQLLPNDARVWIYGSRATGRRIWRGSDLDLLIRAEEALPVSVLGALADDLSESLLPYMVDLHDWHRTNSAFLARIEPDLVPFPMMADAK